MLLLVTLSCQKSNELNISGALEGDHMGEIFMMRGDDTLAFSKITDNKFKLNYIPDEASVVQLYWKKKMIPIQLITEACDIKLDIGEYGAFSLSGEGKYNKAIISSWNALPEFKESQKKANDFSFSKPFAEVPVVERGDFMKEMVRLNAIPQKIQAKEKAKVLQSKDPMVRLLGLAYFGVSRNPEKSLEALNEIEAEVGENFTSKTLRKECDYMINVFAKQMKYVRGKSILDFRGKDINGNTLALSEVYSKNKYTLFEVWSSWCGACRSGFPHLKELYKEYHKKGFEIYGMSVDTSLKRWNKALEQENLPWINVVDQRGRNSEVYTEYGLQGIPFSLLVDNKGIIVGSGLRGNQIDDRVKELFNKK